MSLDDIRADQIDSHLRQTRLCVLVIQDILQDLTDPVTPDSRADLLLASEQLALDAIRLVEQARSFAWQEEPAEIPPDTLL